MRCMWQHLNNFTKTFHNNSLLLKKQFLLLNHGKNTIQDEVIVYYQFNCHSDTHVFMFIITQTLIWLKCKKNAELKSSYIVGFTKSLNMNKCVNTVLNNKIVPEGKLFFSRGFLNTPDVFTWTLASPLDALKE